VDGTSSISKSQHKRASKTLNLFQNGLKIIFTPQGEVEDREVVVVFAGETRSDFAGRLAPTSLSNCIFVELKANTTDIGGNSDEVQA
jgi:hypothetical protein